MILPLLVVLQVDGAADSEDEDDELSLEADTPEDQALAAIDEQAVVHPDDGEAGEDQPTPDMVPEIPGAPPGWHPPRPPDKWDSTTPPVDPSRLTKES
jgi:hypothetical protein